ncbi:hypothetical protein GLX_31700 (plasmid) [Komagataeibacter medellinensis NBRC 3288]|uniref:Uncharacterized protein n=1 Tax=Komagataeibacter medellinensis (strain NBRC 3288 / BCRC 11682 / LMG 1693 / Kondo 51) TaxID=634177 RepID=G2I8T1_KOMMN|nr:hypothetical protein GLX_31700 [Komagataeibacter medellinensis NBRC 3288]
MPLGLPHRERCFFQTLLDPDHRARGEPLPPVPVFPERDQLRTCLHPNHDSTELRGIRRMPVHEPRQVLTGECALLSGQRLQRHMRLGQQPLAIASRDLQMVSDPLRVLAPLFPTHAGRTDLVLRLKIDPLCHERPMIDPHIQVQFSQPFIGERRPSPPPCQQEFFVIPRAFFRAEPLLVHKPRGQHHMRMGLRLTVLTNIPMHIEIGNYAAFHELLPHEIPCQCDPLRLGHFARD